MITEEQKAYLAGFCDGESCIHMSRVGCVNLAVSQVNPNPLVLLGQFLGKDPSVLVENRKTGQRARWHVTLSGRALLEKLSLLLPYLRVKRKQVEAALYLYSLPSIERRDKRDLVNALNAVGKTGPAFPKPPRVDAGIKRFPAWDACESAYHAGFFDAEGCVNCGAHNGLKVIVTQIDPTNVLADLSAAFSVNVNRNSSAADTRNSRPLHTVVLYGDKGYVYLSFLRPYLLVKGPQADVFMEWYDTRGIQQKQNANERLHNLNLRGLQKNAEHTVSRLMDEWCPVNDSQYTSPWQVTAQLSTVPEGLVMQSIAEAALESRLYKAFDE